ADRIDDRVATLARAVLSSKLDLLANAADGRHPRAVVDGAAGDRDVVHVRRRISENVAEHLAVNEDAPANRRLDVRGTEDGEERSAREDSCALVRIELDPSPIVVARRPSAHAVERGERAVYVRVPIAEQARKGPTFVDDDAFHERLELGAHRGL